MELKRRKMREEVRKAWTCEITWFLDQVAGLDERLHYIVINDLILFDDEEPATYYIRVPGGTVGSIFLDDDYNIKEIFIDLNNVVESYPANINKQMKKFIGESKSDPEGPFAEYLRSMIYEKIPKDKLDDMKIYLKEHDVTFVFECCDMKNDPHIIEYPESKLVLLDIIYNTLDFEKYDYEDIEH